MADDTPLVDGVLDRESDALSAVGPFPASVSDRSDTRFKPGNQAALKHGVYAAKPVEVLPADVQNDIDAFRVEVLADLGGEAELSAIELGYVRRLLDVEAVVRLSALNIARNGFTAKSEGMLLQGVDRWDRIASRLGMKRRVKTVADLTIEEYVAAMQRRREQEGGVKA